MQQSKRTHNALDQRIQTPCAIVPYIWDMKCAILYSLHHEYQHGLCHFLFVPLHSAETRQHWVCVFFHRSYNSHSPATEMLCCKSSYNETMHNIMLGNCKYHCAAKKLNNAQLKIKVLGWNTSSIIPYFLNKMSLSLQRKEQQCPSCIIGITKCQLSSARNCLY